MKINPNANFKDLTSSLDQNLIDENSITPHSDNIPKILSKGIYFWFMHPDGYKALSNYVAIEPITQRYTKEINDVKYDLVYLGTTGTGKQGKSNLHGRLKWHINQYHSESTICRKESILSTLRTALGALLADDLIIPDTKSIVNTFMKKYTRVFWIEYPDNKQLIDSDEKILINGIKPLINIQNNPNALQNANNNPTITYKLRRNLVEKNTKSRLGFDNNKPKNTKTEMTTKPILSNNINNSTGVYNSCVEFRVTQNQSIAVVAGTIRNLPVGPCTIEIINAINRQNVYVQNNGNPIRIIRTAGRTVSQYFNSPDTAIGLYKWEVVRNEMIEKNIENISVTVCPI